MTALAQTHAQNNELATEQLSKFYREFYQITLADGAIRALTTSEDSSDDGRFNIFEGVYKSMVRQHWIIMPLTPDSKEYFLVEMKKGLVADIFRTNNLAARPRFTGDNSQTFKLGESASGKITIHSPKDITKVLTLRHGQNVVFRKINPNEAQEFELIRQGTFANGFSSYIRQSNVAILKPPVPTDTQTSDQCMEGGKQIVGETVLPFMMVKDDCLDREGQLAISPYYKIRRSQYWRKVGEPKTVKPGSTQTLRYTQKKGIEPLKQQEVSACLSIGFSVDGEIAFEVPEKGGEASENIAKALGSEFNLGTKTVKNLDETSEETFGFEREYEVDETTMFIEYQLVDHYMILRMDGSEVLDWEVGRAENCNKEVAFSEHGATPKSQGARTVIASRLNADLSVA